MAGGTKIGGMYMSIGGDLAPLDRALNSAKSAASAAGRKVDQTFATMKRSAKSVENAVFSLKGMLVGLGSAAAIYKANAALSESIALSNEQIAMETRLQAVLKATGQAAGYNIDELKDMAGGMQAVTTVGDEVILRGMAILATFKEVRGEGFERATMAALDMAEVMGQDLNSSLVQVGKALNDPVKGMTALSRVGVSFTEQQREQVKVLQQSGDMMAAQAVILNELESEFGGTAAAARNQFGGGVTAATNALGDLKEQVGYTITKNQEMIAVTGRFEGVFNNWIAAVERGQASSEGLDGSFDELLLTLDEVGQEFFETLPGRINATITAIGSASAKVAELTGTVDALAQQAGGWGQVSDYGLAGYALFGKPGPLKFVAVLNTVHAAYAAVMGLKDQLAQSNSDLFGVDQVGMELVQVQEQIAAIEATESRRFAVKQKRLEELRQTEAELQAEMERRLDVQISVSDELDTLMASEAAFTGAVGQAAEAFKGANQEMVAAKKAATTAICAENKKIVSCEETKGRALLKAAHEQWTLNQELNDNLASSEAEKNAKILSELDDYFEEEKRLYSDSRSEIIGLQELLVNDLGRIGNSYFNEILSGQLRTGEDMIQGFLDYIKNAVARLMAQLATNSLVDAIFGNGASGGLTLGSLFSGGSGGGLSFGNVLSSASTIKSGSSLLGGSSGGGIGWLSGPTSGGALNSAGNLATYGSSVYSAWSSGVGTAASWYAGTQAANMGVNAGTQLALIEGTYGAAQTGAAAGATQAVTEASASTAAGGTAGISGGVAGLGVFGAFMAGVMALDSIGHNSGYDRETIPTGLGNRVLDNVVDPNQDRIISLDEMFRDVRSNTERMKEYAEAISFTGDRASEAGSLLMDTGQAAKLLDHSLDRAGLEVETLAYQFGNTTAQMALSLDGTTESTDIFIDALAGYNVSIDEAARLNTLATQAAAGSTVAFDALYSSLLGITSSAEDARIATLGMISAVNDLSSTPLSVNVAVNATGTGQAAIANTSVLQTTTAIDPWWLQHSKTQENYASGGIMTRPTVFDVVNRVGGEAGPEAILPLHNGPDTLAKMDRKLDALADRPIVINFHGDAAALRQFIRLEADQLRVEVNDANLDPLQRAVY